MSTKSLKTTFWISTILIFLFEGLMPALTSQTELAKEGLRHLGYPSYFGIMLTVFKVLGVLALVIPKVPSTLKEWAYAGFTFNFIAAGVSHAVIDGIGAMTLFPLIVLAILMLSYYSYHQLKSLKTA